MVAARYPSPISSRPSNPNPKALSKSGAFDPSKSCSGSGNWISFLSWASLGFYKLFFLSSIVSLIFWILLQKFLIGTRAPNPRTHDHLHVLPLSRRKIKKALTAPNWQEPSPQPLIPLRAWRVLWLQRSLRLPRSLQHRQGKRFLQRETW